LTEQQAHLEEQRGLADARIAPDEHERAGHQPTAQDPVELRHAARRPVAVALHADLGQRLWPARGGAGAPRRAAGGHRALLHELHEGADPRAVRAGPRLGCGEAALLAAVDRAVPRHHWLPPAAWVREPDSIVERIRLRSRKL